MCPEEDVRRKRGSHAAGRCAEQPPRPQIPDDPGVVPAMRKTQGVRDGANDRDGTSYPERDLQTPIRRVAAEPMVRWAQERSQREPEQETGTVSEPSRHMPQPGGRRGTGEQGNESQTEQCNLQSS